jgi:hypothetical protein
VLGDLQDDAAWRHTIEQGRQRLFQRNVGRHVARNVEVVGQPGEGAQGLLDRAHLQRLAHADFGRLVEPDVRGAGRRRDEARERFEAQRSAAVDLADRLVDDGQRVVVQCRLDASPLGRVLPRELQFPLDEAARDLGQHMHQSRVAVRQRVVRPRAEATEGAIDGPVAQSDRDAQVRAHGQGCRCRERAGGRQLLSVVDEFGQPAIEHALAVALLEGIRGAGADHLHAGGGVHISEDTQAVLEPRNEGYVHVQMRPDRTQQVGQDLRPQRAL